MIDSQPMTYEQFKARKKRREATYLLGTDEDAAGALRAADERLRKARLTRDPDELTAAQPAHDEALAAVQATTIPMRLRALPREGDGSYAVLKAEHPPTGDDHARVQQSSGDPKAKAVWCRATFGPALVAASLIDPQVTPEQAVELAEDLNEGEWNGLFAAALDVNQSATDTEGARFPAPS